jgi:hypothetical protein
MVTLTVLSRSLQTHTHAHSHYKRALTHSHTKEQASMHACVDIVTQMMRIMNVRRMYCTRGKTTEIVCMQPATGNKEATKSQSGTLRPSSPPWRAVSCRQLPNSVAAHSSLRPTHATALPIIRSLLMRCLSVCAPQPAFLKHRLAEGLLFELRHMKLRVKMPTVLGGASCRGRCHSGVTLMQAKMVQLLALEPARTPTLTCVTLFLRRCGDHRSLLLTNTVTYERPCLWS